MIRRGAAAAIAVACAVTGCALGEDEPAATSVTSSQSPSSSSRPAPRAVTLDRRLVRDLEEVLERHPEDEIAVALAPVGRARGAAAPGGVSSGEGAPETLVAWSTIKVPLALAARRSGDPATTRADTELAITASDNEAAARLWEGLGGGTQAARAVEEVLAAGGDRRTRVPATAPVAGYSPFGQARWRLADQARFTAALPCSAGSSAVLDPMGRVAPGHAWGLGTLRGARYKGGWGPTPDGYVTRQLGLLPGTKGASSRTAVAVQVRSADHSSGTAVVTEVAEVLRRHLARLPAGRC